MELAEERNALQNERDQCRKDIEMVRGKLADLEDRNASLIAEQETITSKVTESSSQYEDAKRQFEDQLAQVALARDADEAAHEQQVDELLRTTAQLREHNANLESQKKHTEQLLSEANMNIQGLVDSKKMAERERQEALLKLDDQDKLLDDKNSELVALRAQLQHLRSALRAART